MTLHVRDTSGQNTIGTVRVRDASGLSIIGQIRVRDPSNILVEVFGSFSLTANTLAVYGSTTSHAPATVTTGYVTVTPNPAGAATYAWTAADAGWTATSPTSAVTAFRYTGLGPGADETTTFTCTATRGTATATIDISANVSNFGI